MEAQARKRYSPRRPRAERREQVLDAALRVLDAHGFAGVTVERVAAEADLAKTVVYDTVGNQSKLLRELVTREQKRAIADIATALPVPPFDSPADLLGDGIATLLEAVRRHPATWRLIMLPPEGTPPGLRKGVDRYRASLRTTLVPIVRWGLEQLDADDLDAEISTHTLLAALESAIRLTLTDPKDFPPERLADYGRAIVRRIA